MFRLAHLLRKKSTKYSLIATIEKFRTLGFRFAVVLGGIKLKILSTLGFFFCLNLVSQTQVVSSSHQVRVKALEIMPSIGKNNIGYGAGLYYYVDNNIHLKFFGSLRKFEYLSYSEDITDFGLEVGVTLYEGDNRGRNSLLGGLNITPTFGISGEIVKVTSETIITDPYPKYFYVYLGGILEYTIHENVGINLFFREFYAVNGKKEELGNWRYDIGVGLRYYIF